MRTWLADMLREGAEHIAPKPGLGKNYTMTPKRPLQQDSQVAFLDRWFTSQTSVEQVVETIANASAHGVDAELNAAAVRRISRMVDSMVAERHVQATNRATQRALVLASAQSFTRRR